MLLLFLKLWFGMLACYQVMPAIREGLRQPKPYNADLGQSQSERTVWAV